MLFCLLDCVRSQQVHDEQMTRDLSLAYCEEIESKEGKTVVKVQKLPSLHRAVKRRKIRSFFTRKSSLIKLDENGRTALHLAAIEGHFNTIKKLIKLVQKRDLRYILNQKDNHGNTALTYAIDADNPDCAQLMISCGCHIAEDERKRSDAEMSTTDEDAGPSVDVAGPSASGPSVAGPSNAVAGPSSYWEVCSFNSTNGEESDCEDEFYEIERVPVRVMVHRSYQQDHPQSLLNQRPGSIQGNKKLFLAILSGH